jgi:predicted amidohydrolase YtcJ
VVTVAGVPAPPGAVDLRMCGGLVSEVAPRLSPMRGERVHEAEGRWAIPGLWDQHVHLTQWGLMAIRLDLAGTSGPQAVVERLQRHVRALPPDQAGSLVQGWGHRSATWPRRPTVAELDAVSAGHPVVLISGDGHNGWLNSRALALLGVAPRAGALEENEWFEVLTRLGALTGASEQQEQGVRTAAERAAAQGVVGIVDMEFGPNHLDWPRRFDAGVTSLRVRGATYPDRLEEVLAAGLHTGARLRSGGGLLTMGPLKIISDGSLNTRTACCCDPYVDAGPSEFPRGRRNTSVHELVELFGRARQGGLDVAVHAIGDAAATSALEAFELTGARGSVEHAQLLATADIARMARLGIRASVQPAHLLDDRDVTMQCWPDRADRCFPFRSLVDAGVVLGLGSDAPVAPLDPWLAMAAAVHRSGDAREPWHPEQAVSAAQALAASTDGQATLRPGSRADVVLLDADPLAGGSDSREVAAHLRTMRVAATFLAGRPTYPQA